MELAFCGTPQFAVPTLDRLLEAEHHILLVVTQPDRPSGRGLETTTSPVKQRALALGLPLAQPDQIRSHDAFRSQLASLKPDAIIVVGYGRIIPRWMIDLPRHGNLNLHASLLPKYRGAAPVQWAIANGEAMSGVTIMRIDEGLDTGDILLQEQIAITPLDTALTLASRLADVGARLMVETLWQLEAGTLKARSQDHAQATLAPLLKKEDGRIDFTWTAMEIHNRQRGFQPWPGVFTTFRGKSLTLGAVQPVEGTAVPHAELRVEDGRLLLGCGQGTVLEIAELQPEGKKRMKARDFLHGYRPRDGERLGGPS
ncbi:MAG: methionyl-tRNA formyltransferase [Acidobacteria bacterium]|nr:methionyl-tRNA formyltransferase [Acidobacteriota bacterium]